MLVCLFVFFFQAEDGIRDDLVTGVQTCALPICRAGAAPLAVAAGTAGFSSPLAESRKVRTPLPSWPRTSGSLPAPKKIGRASCRERVEISEVGGAVKEKK